MLHLSSEEQRAQMLDNILDVLDLIAYKVSMKFNFNTDQELSNELCKIIHVLLT